MINFIPKFGEFLCYNQNIKHKVKKRALNIHLFSDSYLVSGAAVWAELLTPTLRGHHLQEDPQVDTSSSIREPSWPDSTTTLTSPRRCRGVPLWSESLPN